MNSANNIPSAEQDRTNSRSSSLAIARVLVRIAISIALIATVIVRAGDDALWQTLSRGLQRGGWLALAIIGFPAFGYWVSMIRLRSLLEPHKITLKRREIMRAQLMGSFFNQLLPTSIGGDAHRVWYLGKQTGQASIVFSAIFLARLLGVVSLCLLAIGGIVLRPAWLQEVPALSYGVLAAGGIVVIAALVLALVTPIVPAHEGALWWQRVLHKVTAALAQYRREPRVLCIALLLSMILQLEIVLQYWLFVWCLQIELNFYQLMVAIPMITLASMLPISFNGIGVREWVMIWICAPLGVERPDAAMVAMLFLAAQLLYAMIGGVVVYRTSAARRT